MADVLVQVNSVAPSGLSWGSVFSWTSARVINAGTLIAVTNSDGSVTLISGTGLMLDANGEPTGGTVEQITHQAADGVLFYQYYSFTPASQPSLAVPARRRRSGADQQQSSRKRLLIVLPLVMAAAAIAGPESRRAGSRTMSASTPISSSCSRTRKR